MNRSPASAVLTGLASYLPEERLTNEMLAEEFPDLDPKKIEVKTGIANRRRATDGVYTSDLAMLAANNLFALDPGHKEGIDFLILVTVSPDYLVPGTAALIQSGLELPSSVGAVDLQMACAGYTYALGMASAMIESGRASKILLITADRYTPYGDRGVQGVKSIFGDAATATLLERSDNAKGGVVGASCYGTDGTGARNLIIPTSGMKGILGDETNDVGRPTLEMDGAEVFNFTLRVIPGHVQESLDASGVEIDDIDLFIFHQANAFMLNHLRRRMKIPEEKFVLFINDVGNTGASTIPLALESAMKDGRVQPGSRVLLVGFGTGYSWSSALVEYAE